MINFPATAGRKDKIMEEEKRCPEPGCQKSKGHVGWCTRLNAHETERRNARLASKSNLHEQAMEKDAGQGVAFGAGHDAGYTPAPPATPGPECPVDHTTLVAGKICPCCGGTGLRP